MRIARVFPSRTDATPTDPLAFYDEPGLFLPDIDEVHVSCTFSWDLPRAEALAEAWRRVAPVSIGGPAYDDPGGPFVAGRYLREGYVITSRGCPTACAFCQAWRREGTTIRELPIVGGWNVLDNNLLACSDGHVRAVFAMLKAEKGKWYTIRHGRRVTLRPQFTGGLEAARLERWHAELLRDLRPEQAFFAYDEPADREHLERAGTLLADVGFTRTSKVLRAYVLIGRPGDTDTLAKAEARLLETWHMGFWPAAMLWHPPNQPARRTADVDPDWARLTRTFFRPAATRAELIRRGMLKENAR